MSASKAYIKPRREGHFYFSLWKTSESGERTHITTLYYLYHDEDLLHVVPSDSAITTACKIDEFFQGEVDLTLFKNTMVDIMDSTPPTTDHHLIPDPEAEAKMEKVFENSKTFKCAYIRFFDPFPPEELERLGLNKQKHDNSSKR